jgi:uncharacterized membrane protein YkvA (DUF1232 family)
MIARSAGLLLVIMYAAGRMWWRSVRPGSQLSANSALAATGLLFTVWALCYRTLPLDLIPSWVPIFGRLDDAPACVGPSLSG